MFKQYALQFFILFTVLLSAQDKTYEKGLKAFDSKNYLKSFELLKPYADKGDDMAEFVVGFCYLNPELSLKNDSLAEQYLSSSADKLNAKAMNLLCIYYLQKGKEDDKNKIQSLVWAEIAASYDPVSNASSARYLIKNYLNQEQLKLAEEILTEKKKKFNKINIEAFQKMNQQMKSKNKNTEKTIVPANSKELMSNPYLDWVYRWKLEKFECDTFYYTSQPETKIIEEAINKIKASTSFEIHYLYNGSQKKDFKITTAEQAYLIKELENLKQYNWPKDLFPFSKRLEQNEIQNTFDLTEKLSTEKEKNMCSIVYTFSKPIFIKENTIALYLDQKRYRGNYTQLEFSFYKFENNNWEKIAVVYSYYEESK